MSTFVPPLTTYRAAAIQYEPALGEKEKNITELLALVEEAARNETRLIVLPEMATTGYCWISREEIAPYTEPIPGPTTARFQHLASTYGCFIAIGLPELDPATQVYYNSMALLGPEGLIGVYRKLHSSIAEPRWARDGDLGIVVWETALGRVSALLGTDAMYFESARLAALRGADLLLLPANSFDEQCPSSWWMARAFENGVYVIAANRHGSERGVQFNGGSGIVSPDGTIQSYLENGVGISYGEIELAHARQKRWQHGATTLGFPLADRQPTAYTPLVQNSYLWEPLRSHSLYALGELPPGQLSCVGFMQMKLTAPQEASHHNEAQQETTMQTLEQLVLGAIRDNSPACPDVLVLPELVLPGPGRWGTRQPTADELGEHFRRGAIQIPGPETEALVELVRQLQLSLVIGVAERAATTCYNTVLLLDPEGIYGIYRKIHLSPLDRLWATPGDKGFGTFDTPAGRIGLATGYDVLFPETLRVLAGKGTDLVCAPALLAFPGPGRPLPTPTRSLPLLAPEEETTQQHPFIWRVRAAEHNVYLALANWYGEYAGIRANGLSGIFSPASNTYPWPEVVADADEPDLLLMMTIDTREQRTGRRTTRMLEYSPGDMAGSLTGELAYNILDSIPGNVVRSKPFLRKRLPFWYLDLLRTS